MKKINIIISTVIIITIIGLVSGFNNKNAVCHNPNVTVLNKPISNQTVNMFVSHGHCSLPFRGIVNNLSIIAPKREDLGNPLEGMNISFEIDPNSFNACRGKDLTERVKTPGVFISESNDKIIFKSTNVFTMGVDWYQVNGRLSIKGIEKDVKFFATGIREPNATTPCALVLEGQLNLLDWGIDFDKIVNGKSNDVPTKWMHLNMKIEMI